VRAPLPIRLFNTFPALRRIPGHFIGMGVRPEHVDDDHVLKEND
jgi:hypothetical protein